MENTVTKGYSKKTNSDGSVELSFKSKRFGVGTSPTWIMVVLVVVMLSTCAATYPFIPMTRNDYGSLRFDKGTWAMVSFPLYLVIIWLISNTKDVITVKPGEGLMFRGQSLPFSDISDIGVTTEHGGRAVAALVYATANGAKVNLSRSVTPELANAIRGEIFNLSLVRKA